MQSLGEEFLRKPKVDGSPSGYLFFTGMSYANTIFGVKTWNMLRRDISCLCKYIIGKS